LIDPQASPRESQEAAVERLGRGASLALLGSVLGRVVNFVGQVVVARWLGPAMLGLYALGWGAFRLLSLPATLGINNGLQRFGSISRSRAGFGGKELLRRALGLTLATSGLVGLGLVAASPWLSTRVYGEERLLPILVVFGLALPAAAVLRVAAAATRVSQDLRASVVLEDFGQPFLFAVLAALILNAGAGVLGVAAAAALSFALVAPFAFVWARRWFPRSDVSEPVGSPWVSASVLVRYSVPTALAGTVGVTMTWLDRLLVGYYMPSEAVGWYQVAAQASGAFAVVLGAFSAIFGPMIAGLLERGERERLQELFRVATKWGVLAVLPGAALCLLFPGPAIVAIFGPDYLPAAVPLLILVVGQVLTAATGAVGYLLMMGGQQNLWLGLSLAALAADIVLNIVLIPEFGLAGAAAATTLAVGALYISGLVAVRRQLGLWPYDRRFLGVAATVVVALGGSAMLHLASGLGPLATVLAVVLAAAGLTLVGWRLFCFGDEDRLLFSTLARLGR
jgi:O-antigen/teichoic acid export membrane protein